MQAAIAYGNGELEACERDDVWTVRLASLEAHARYLDVALARLLGDAREAHRVAARLLAEVSEPVERQEPAHPHGARVPRREQRGGQRKALWSKPLVLGLRVSVFAAVATAAFVLTTWFSALR